MIVNPVCSKSGKELNSILKIKQKNRTKTSQKTAKETQIFKLAWKARKHPVTCQKASQITGVYSLLWLMTTFAGAKAQKMILTHDHIFNDLNLLKTWPFSSHELYTCKGLNKLMHGSGGIDRYMEITWSILTNHAHRFQDLVPDLARFKHMRELFHQS